MDPLRQLARVHTDSIAKLPLAKLGPQHIERLYAERLKAGSADLLALALQE
ncbi:MAG: hypothetical protein HYY42_07495 [Chloroflexi bacterium]|nr:hypothetical protein [Chloroflexota bacterium]MBI2984000.1 hypothetical protein [Chloroflexota bacterium]